MFFKYTIVTVVCAIVITGYLREYRNDVYCDSQNKLIVFYEDIVKTLASFVRIVGISPEADISKDPNSKTPQTEELFSVDELKLYTGESGNKIYLSILGKVYDVSAGRKHYGPGGSYHFFAGKDGSRSFVTGDFISEDSTDDVTGLTPGELKSLVLWDEFYQREYSFKGKLIGRFYDADGKKTPYYIQIDQLIDEATEEEELENRKKINFPPCNAEWSQESGSRVWCTTLSGGIVREWVGVPRQLYLPGSESFRCACVQLDKLENPSFNKAQFKEYPNCNSKSSSCQVET